MTAMVLEIAVKSLLEGLAIGDVYAQAAPDKTQPPYLIYQRISADRWRSLDGPSGMAQPRIRVDCYSEGYLIAKQMAGTVRQKLDGLRATQDGIRIGGCSLLTETDLFDDTVKPKLHRVSMDFLFTHDET